MIKRVLFTGFLGAYTLAFESVDQEQGEVRVCNHAPLWSSIMGLRSDSMGNLNPQGWKAHWRPLAQGGDLLLDSSSMVLFQNKPKQCKTWSGWALPSGTSTAVLNKIGSCGGVPKAQWNQSKWQAGLWTPQRDTLFELRLPSQNLNVNGTGAAMRPELVPGSLYWMGLAFLRENMGVDPLLILAQWAKETGFLLEFNGNGHWYEQIGTQSDGAMGPGEVETYTLASRALSMGGYFPYDTCVQQITSISEFQNSCHQTLDQWAQRYFGPSTSVLSSQSARIANAQMITSLVHINAYQILNASVDLHWKAALNQTPDEDMGLSVLLGMYNLGINGFNVSPLESTSLALLSRYSFSVGNGNYRTDILNVRQALKDAQDNQGLPVVQRRISLDDAAHFFFGDSAKALALSTHLSRAEDQVGGILLHYALDSNTRSELWSQVQDFWKIRAQKLGAETEPHLSLVSDWVPLLRQLQKFLPDQVHYPVGQEMARWIQDHSRSSKDFEGVVLDSTAPRISRSCVSADQCTWQFVEDGVRDKGLMSLEWTADSAASYWNLDRQWNPSASKISVWSGPHSYGLGLGQKVWLRLADSCGNALVFADTVRNDYTPVRPGVNVSNIETYTAKGLHLGAGNVESIQEVIRMGQRALWGR